MFSLRWGFNVYNSVASKRRGETWILMATQTKGCGLGGRPTGKFTWTSWSSCSYNFPIITVQWARTVLSLCRRDTVIS